MGSSNSTESHSRRRPDTSSGFLGRGRMTRHYSDVTVYVKEISKRSLGHEKLRRCGNEGANNRRYLEGYIDYEEYLEIEITKQILEAAISFVPDAEEDGADLTNAAFIVSQPGRSFVIQAGGGDWEYVFEREYDGEIYGRNVRKPFLRYIYNKVKNVVSRYFPFALSLAFSPLKALTDKTQVGVACACT